MKRLIGVLVVLILTLQMSYGDATTDITIILDGEQLVLETPPMIINGRTVVPVRFLFEPLGLTVSSNPQHDVAIGQKEGLYIVMPIGSKYASVNKEVVVLDSPAIIINDRTYVPLRFVAESTGAKVIWDDKTHMISIISEEGKEKNYQDYLEAIQADAEDYNGSNYLQNRLDYHKIVEDISTMKDGYVASQDGLLNGLSQLAESKHFIFPTDNLQDNVRVFHDYMMTIHEQDTHNNQLVTGDGYYNLHYDGGYLYGYYKDFQATGYLFAYTKVDSGYIISLEPFTNDKRQGFCYQQAYNDNDELLYDAFYHVDQGDYVDLVYRRYTVGIEVFDVPQIDDDTVVRIDADGTYYIPPHIEGISNLDNEGVGFVRFNTGVEYVGIFDEWDRLGVGMYFAPDDSSRLEENLVTLRIEEILEEIIGPEMTDEEKIKAIHDYLTAHITYDPNAVEGESSPMSHTAYGALINGIAVCDGYAEAFKFLLDRVGIENVLIFGESNENGEFSGDVNHAWNLVEINGVYFHYDLTWDDDDVNQKTVYTYYHKKSNFMDDTHQWDANRYAIYLN